MQLIQSRTDTYVTRDGWKYQGDNSTPLVVKVTTSKELFYYMNKGVPGKILREASTAFRHDDFFYCDKFGRRKENQSHPNKDSTMTTDKPITDDTVVVTNSKTNTAEFFDTEDLAYGYIEEQMDEYPRASFVMFKPYQKIANKKFNFKDLITKIKG